MANKKRFLAILLTVLMFVQMMPASLAATLTSNPVGDDYFQVVFMDGESTIATQYIKEGGALVLPEDPAHNGYEFAGWFSGDTQYNAGDAVNADLTLNARFNAIVRYTVTIQYVKVENGADVPVATPVVREYAASETDVVDSIDSPEVEALFPDQNPVTITVADLPDLVDENGAYTIRVVYSATSTDYAIHHLFENVDGTEFVHDPAYDETGHGVVGTRVTADALETVPAGFTYKESEAVTLAESGTVVNVTYTRNTNFLLFDTQGGTVADGISARYGTEVPLPTAEQVTRLGYTLSGWYTDPACTEETKVGEPGASYNMPAAEHTTLYAGWIGERVNYKIVYWLEKPNISVADTPNLNTTPSDVSKYSYYTEKNMTVSADGQSGGAIAGSTITAADVTRLTDAEIQSLSGTSVSIAEFHHCADTEVAGDGTTIVNVYYNRKVFSYTFYLGTNHAHSMTFLGNTYTDGGTQRILTCTKTEHEHSYWDGCYDRRGNLTCGLEEHEHTNSCYTTVTTDANNYVLYAKYEMDISGLWPAQDTSAVFSCSNGDKFNQWSPSGTVSTSGWITKRLTLTPEMLPTNGESATLNASWSSTTSTRTVSYYIEALPGETGTSFTNGNGTNVGSYVKSDRYSQTYYSNQNLSPKDIEGTTKVIYSQGYNGADYDFERSSSSTYTFLYKRNRHSLSFDIQLGGGTLKAGVTAPATVSDILYGQSLADFAPAGWDATVTKTVDGVTYTFGGWYNTADCYDNDEFDFSAEHTMPDLDLTAYAKWNVQTVVATVNLNIYTGEEDVKSFTIPVGGTIAAAAEEQEVTLPPTLTRPGYTFEGWYTTADFQEGTRISAYAPISADTTVYAKWAEAPTSYTVRYLKQDGNGDWTIPVATQKTFANQQIGASVTANALTVPNMRPDALTKGIDALVADSTQNVIEFHYSVVGAVQYTVEYGYMDGDTFVKFAESIIQTKVVETEKLRVVETAADVDGWYPTQKVLWKTLVTDESQNVMQFVYRPYQSVSYTIEHYYEDAAGTETYDGKTYAKKDAYTKTGTARIGNTVYATKREEGAYIYAGFVSDPDGVALVAVVDAELVELTNGSYTLKLYYNIGYAEYTVNYLEKGTTNALEEPKTLGDVRVGTVITGVSEEIEIQGYKYDSSDPESITVGAGTNVINLYYVKDDSQTKTITYSVNYYKDNVKVDADSYSVPTTVWVNDPDTVTVGAIDTANDKYVGYKFDSTNPDPIPATAADGDVINVYYVADNFGYTIHHYLVGTEIPVADDYTGTATFGTTFSVNVVANPLYGAQIASYDPATTKETSADADENVIIVYYRIPIELEAAKADQTYNGSALTAATATPATHTVGETVNAFTVSMTDESTITHVLKDSTTGDVIGVVNVIASVSLNGGDAVEFGEADTVNVGYYAVTRKDGELKINPREIEITAASALKTFDDEELTANDYSITSGSFVNEEGFDTVTVVGSQTEVGSSANEIEGHTFKANTQEDDYIVTYQPGTLTVIDGTAITSSDASVGTANASQTVSLEDGVTLGSFDTLPLMQGETKVGEFTNANGALVFTQTAQYMHALNADSAVAGSVQIPVVVEGVAGTLEVTVAITDISPTIGDAANSISEDAEPNTIDGDVVTDNHTLGDGTFGEHSFAWDGEQEATYGTITLNADGTYAYALDNSLAAVQALGEGDTLTETFTYSFADKDGDSDTGTLTITITGTDDAPTIGDAANSIAEDAEPNTIDGDVVTDNHTLGDGTFGEHSFAWDGEQEATYGTITLNADGTYAYALDNSLAAVQALGEGDTLTETFTYSFADKDGDSDTGTLTITITGTDDAPTVESFSHDIKVAQDGSAIATGNALTGSTLGDGTVVEHVFAWGNEEAGYGAMTKGDDAAYTYELDLDSAAVLALKSGDVLTETFGYTYTDKDGDFDSGTITIRITGVGYTVEHYLADLNGDYPTIPTGKTDECGIEGQMVDAADFEKDADSNVDFTGFDLASCDPDGPVAIAVDENGDGTTVLRLYYARNVYGYTVHYYRDEIDPENLLTTDTGNAATFGATIPHTTGTDLPNDAEFPAGYATPGALYDKSGAAITVAPTIGADAQDNVLNVVYTVKEHTITLTADSNEKVYDATPLTDAGFTAEVTGLTAAANLDEAGENIVSYTLETGDTLVVTVEGTITNVKRDASENVIGEANVVTGYQVLRGDRDVTDYYTFADPVEGALKILPRPLTLIAADRVTDEDGDPIVYDGLPHGQNGYTYKDGEETGAVGEELLPAELPTTGDVISTVSIGDDQTEVGTYELTFDPAVTVIENTAGEDVTANYDLTYEPGDLVIIRRGEDPKEPGKDPEDPEDPDDPESWRVIVRVSDLSIVYGQDPAAQLADALANGTVTMEAVNLAPGQKLNTANVTFELDPTAYPDGITGSGDYRNAIKVSGAQIVDANGQSVDVGNNYYITYIPGDLHVTAISYTVHYYIYRNGRRTTEKVLPDKVVTLVDGKDIAIGQTVTEASVNLYSRGYYMMSTTDPMYRLGASATPPTQNLEITLEGPNEMAFYFTPNLALSYTINYIYIGDSSLNASETVYPVVLNQGITDISARVQARTIYGYTLRNIEGLPLRIGGNEDENVINVYFVPRETYTILDLEVPIGASLGALNVGDCCE